MIENFDNFCKRNPEKKIVIFYGNCHTSAMQKILQLTPSFLSQFAIYPILPIQDVKNPDYFDLDCFAKCDVFIHQSIRKENRYGPQYSSENIIRKLKSNCNIISIPNLYHLPTCFFPQYVEKTVENEFINIVGKNTEFFRDSIIDSAYYERLSISDTKKRYCDPDLFSFETIHSSFEAFFEKVKVREKDWDIRILDYLIENYQAQHLFYDPNHPTDCVIKEIVIRLLRHLDVSVDDTTINNISTNPMDTFEMPICESVYKSMGMNWKRKNIRDGKKGLISNLSLEKYIKKYRAFEIQNNHIPLSSKVGLYPNYYYLNLGLWAEPYIKAAQRKVKRLFK